MARRVSQNRRQEQELWSSSQRRRHARAARARGRKITIVLLVVAVCLAVAVPFAFALRSRLGGALAALASGLAEPAGALLAMLFLRRWFTPGFLNGTVVLVAGVMLWVALAQLLPSAWDCPHRKTGLLGIAAGVLVMLLGIAALP